MLTKIRSRIKSRTRGKKQNDQHPTSVVQDGNRARRNADTGTSIDIPTRKNLWEVAGERLEEKCRIALDLENTCSVTDSIEDVIKTTEERYREYQEGGLKIRKRGGGQINVRDSVRNIILYTLQAQDIVKTLVSFDPTGHASSAWSVVSIGLTLVKNDIERRDDIFEASEYLSQTLSYYTIIDNNYRRRGVGSDIGLEDALIEVYAAILEYTAKVKEAAKESNAARVLKSITALVQQPLKDLKEAVEKRGQAAQKWANITAALDHRKQADSILDKIEQDSERLKAIQAQTRRLQDREILDWLSTASYSDTQNDTQARRAPNTGNWFLNSPSYENWKSSPGKIYWGYGAVGCGKSVLCSAVIQDIKELCESDASKKIAYWYFQFSNDETQKVYNMVRSILRQLMPWTLPAPLVKVWEDQSHRGSKPELQKFQDILDTVLEISQGDSFLIIDAMDECPMNAHDGRGFLLKFIEGLSAKHPSKLHILATSRPEPDIRSRLERYETVDIESGLGGDVETFVHDQISQGRLSEWDEPIKQRALEKLLDIPERRFRWADLQIKRLQESKNEDAFHKALDTIPVTLEDTYRDILERLSPDDRDAARTILIWLSFAFEPLDLKTLAAAVSFRFPDDVVKTCTTSLVTVSISNGIVRLAHFSVKEFLVCEEAQCLWYQFSEVSGHSAILNKAIDALLETTEVITKSAAEQRPLLIYSANYWNKHHVEVEGAYIGCASLQQKVDRLFTKHDVYINWVRYSNYQFSSPGISPLGFASFLGLRPVVEKLLAETTDCRFMTEYPNNCAFGQAAMSGYLDVLELLVESVHGIPRETIQDVLSCIEVTEGNKDRLPILLDLLWDKDYLHDQSRSSRKTIDERLAGAAASNRKCGDLLMNLLLDRKEKMDIKITERLLYRVTENYKHGARIMELLFDKCDADIKLTPSLKEKIASSCDPSVLIVCMNRRMNDFGSDEDFIKGMSRGKSEAMELLLQKHGNKVRITQEVLVWSARRAPDPQMVSLLLRRRDHLTKIDKKVFRAAARRKLGGCEVMEMLLDECEPDTVIDDEIIQEIALNRNEGLGIMKLLVCRQQTGFIVTEQTLCNAARKNGPEMMELLVNNAGGSDLVITGKVLQEIAGNRWRGEELLAYLYDLKGQDLPVSENLLVSIAGLSSYDSGYMLMFFLERWPELPVTDRLLEAACLDPAFGLLLGRRNDYLPTQRMIQKIINGGRRAEVAFETLFELGIVKVDNKLIEMVADNMYALNVIYSRVPDFPVTPEVISKATSSGMAMRILLDRLNNQVSITEDTIKAALLGVLPHHTIGVLLGRLPPGKLPISEDILIFTIQKSPFFSIECLELFLEHYRDLDLTAVWQAIWEDPEPIPSNLTRAAVYLLQYVKFDISDGMLEKLPAEIEIHDDSEYPFDDLIRSCMLHRISLPTTDLAIELILARSSLNTIDIFLEDHHDIHITQKHMEAAESNPRKDMDKDDLMALLKSRSNPSSLESF